MAKRTAQPVKPELVEQACEQVSQALDAGVQQGNDAGEEGGDLVDHGHDPFGRGLQWIDGFSVAASTTQSLAKSFRYKTFESFFSAASTGVFRWS